MFDTIYDFSDENDSEEKEIIFNLDNIIKISSVDYTIKDILYNLSTISETDLKNVIIRQHMEILNYNLFTLSDEHMQVAQRLFTSYKFLKCLYDVIGLLNLTPLEVKFINKIVYDYSVLTTDNYKDIKELLLSLSYIVNNILILKLTAYMDLNGARILAMLANSSFDPGRCVKRINIFIMRYGNDLPVGSIVDIYCLLTQAVRFNEIFIYSMIETKSNKLSDFESARFDNISLALLSILDNFTIDDIKAVLFNYGYFLSSYGKTNVRFSIRTAIKFPSVMAALKEVLESEFELPIDIP